MNIEYKPCPPDFSITIPGDTVHFKFTAFAIMKDGYVIRTVRDYARVRIDYALYHGISPSDPPTIEDIEKAGYSIEILYKLEKG